MEAHSVLGEGVVMSICKGCPAFITSYRWELCCVLGLDPEFDIVNEAVVPTREECPNRKALDIVANDPDGHKLHAEEWEHHSHGRG